MRHDVFFVKSSTIRDISKWRLFLATNERSCRRQCVVDHALVQAGFPIPQWYAATTGPPLDFASYRKLHVACWTVFVWTSTGSPNDLWKIIAIFIGIGLIFVFLLLPVTFASHLFYIAGLRGGRRTVKKPTLYSQHWHPAMLHKNSMEWGE